VAERQAVELAREEELEEAHAIQRVLLPQEMLRASPVTVAHQFEPVDIVGGDFLDYFQLGDGPVGFYVGDVSGKGLPATMHAALTVECEAFTKPGSRHAEFCTRLTSA
jgi:serine phosphatase RsbU (regulator of sigma subunit)